MGVSVIPLALAAAGEAANMYNQNQTRNDRQNQLMQSLATQRKLQAQADKATHGLVHKIAQSTPTAAKNASFSNFMNVLGANQGRSNADLGQVGNLSGAYQNAAANTASGVADYGRTQANALSSMKAPGLQRQNEGFQMADLGQHLNRLHNEMQSQNFLTKLRLEGIQPNAGIPALSGLLSGVAGSYFNPKVETYANYVKRMQQQQQPQQQNWSSSGWNAPGSQWA